MTDHDVAAFVDVMAGQFGERGAGPARPGLLRRARHGAGAAGADQRDHHRPARGLPRRPPRGGAGAPRHPLRRPHHGVRAEPPPRPAPHRFAFEADRNIARLEAFASSAFGSSTAHPHLRLDPARGRARVIERLRLHSEDVATPDQCGTDRRAALLWRSRSPAPAWSASRFEVRGLREPRCARSKPVALQQGSSAMPHKRDPIRTDGSRAWPGSCAAIRGRESRTSPSHERDISHSGAEQVILPDATILLDYMQEPGEEGGGRIDGARGGGCGRTSAWPAAPSSARAP